MKNQKPKKNAAAPIPSLPKVTSQYDHCHCCWKTVWVWSRGEQRWCDEMPIRNKRHPLWLPLEPDESTIEPPSWVLQARLLACRKPLPSKSIKDHFYTPSAEPEGPRRITLCPRCRWFFQELLTGGCFVV